MHKPSKEQIKKKNKQDDAVKAIAAEYEGKRKNSGLQ